MKIIDGAAAAEKLIDQIGERVRTLIDRTGVQPGLAVILVGDDPASDVYVRRKLVKSARAHIRSFEYRKPADTTEQEILSLIDELNDTAEVHGILVQLPLPPQIDPIRVLNRIDPTKDVDGFHPVNVGRLSTGAGGGLLPCTPSGCMLLLESVISDFRGLSAVVIGKSNVVGKPMAMLLLERECTVAVTHILTRELPEITRKADIVVVAAGKPALVRGSWIRPGAVVIDVGITRIIDDAGKARIVGDVVFEEMDHAAAVTPVPGGVGPMTIACLLLNTILAAQAAAGGARRSVQGQDPGTW